MWRTIEHGLDLVKKGIIWRVGSGSSIQICREPWIPQTAVTENKAQKGQATTEVGLPTYDPWKT
jgi:hypothetical protein